MVLTLFLETVSPLDKNSDKRLHQESSNPPAATNAPAPELPLPDPGNLLDMVDTTEFLSFNRHTDQDAPEVCAGCCHALIVYAAEANKKSRSIKMSDNYRYFLCCPLRL